MVLSVLKTKIHELDTARINLIDEKRVAGISQDYRASEILYLCMGFFVHISLINLLYEHFGHMSVPHFEAIHTKNQVPASAYISGYKVSTMANEQSGSIFYLNSTTLLHSQCVVSFHQLYGGTPLHDVISIEVD